MEYEREKCWIPNFNSKFPPSSLMHAQLFPNPDSMKADGKACSIEHHKPREVFNFASQGLCKVLVPWKWYWQEKAKNKTLNPEKQRNLFLPVNSIDKL